MGAAGALRVIAAGILLASRKVRQVVAIEGV
jgi:hypothetical protein